MSNMTVKVLKEAGYDEAMLGISLNKMQPVENMPAVAVKLAFAKEGSHRKFLRQISVWLQVTCPLYIWTELDTYKVGVTRNSASTMHTPLTHATLAHGCTDATTAAFYEAREMFERGELDIQQYKANIPCGLLLTSVLSMNYESLRTIIKDRRNHKLPEWQVFCNQVLLQLEHPELLV